MLTLLYIFLFSTFSVFDIKTKSLNRSLIDMTNIVSGTLYHRDETILPKAKNQTWLLSVECAYWEAPSVLQKETENIFCHLSLTTQQ